MANAQVVVHVLCWPGLVCSAPDIQRQLPVEAKAFFQVDKQLRDIMRKTKDRPNALQVCAKRRPIAFRLAASVFFPLASAWPMLFAFYFAMNNCRGTLLSSVLASGYGPSI